MSKDLEKLAKCTNLNQLLISVSDFVFPIISKSLIELTLKVDIFRELSLPTPESYTPYTMILDTGYWYSINEEGTEATIDEIMLTLVDVKLVLC